MKFDAKMLATHDYGAIKFVNGKYFYYRDHAWEEIPMLALKALIAKHKDVHSATQVDNIIDMINITNIFDDNNQILDTWFEPPVISEAKRLGVLSIVPALPISVTYKEWVLLSSMILHPERKKFYIIQGKSNSGKSTLLNIVKQVYGDTYSLQFDELDNDFKVSEAITHRLICCDEVGEGHIDGAKLKQIVSHDEMTCNRKNLRPISIKTNSVLIGACNNTPKLMIADDGVITRFCYYLKDTVIENPDPSLAHYTYDEQTLISVVRYCLYVDKTLTKDWFDYFVDETHDLIVKKNSLYIVAQYDGFQHCLDGYKSYRKSAMELGYKPYGYENFEYMLELFKDWGYLNEDGQQVVHVSNKTSDGR